MDISRNGSQSAASGPMDLGALNWRTSSELKHRVMQELVTLRRFIQHPIWPLVGALIGAGTGKTGYGAWAAGMTLASLSTYFGVVATAMLTRNLRACVVRLQRFR